MARFKPDPRIDVKGDRCHFCDGTVYLRLMRRRVAWGRNKVTWTWPSPVCLSCSRQYHGTLKMY